MAIRPTIIGNLAAMIGLMVAPDFAWACAPTLSCSSLANCEVNDKSDATAYACFAREAAHTCSEALSNKSALLYDQRREVRHFYMMNTESCALDLQEAWLNTALIVQPEPGRITHALQVIPTISLGVPVFFAAGTTNGNNAVKALSSVSAVGGLYIRYSPFAMWISAHAFLGTSSVSNIKDLDASFYPAPALTLYGGGVDFLGGVVAVSYIGAALHPSGVFSVVVDETTDATGFLQVSIDLTATALTIAGVANPD
jgi:hypothetical protein